MKKNILLLGCVFIISIFIVSCKSKNTGNEVTTNNTENEITISKNYLIKNDVSGMGTDYEIKNIKKGKYNISLYSKEFAKGKFVQERNLYNTTLDLDKKVNEYNISVYQEDTKIKILTGESEFNETTLEFFETNSCGIALFEIENEKKITIDKELPIIGYIIGDEVKKIEIVNIDEIFNQKSDGEIIIYLKVSKIK